MRDYLSRFPSDSLSNTSSFRADGRLMISLSQIHDSRFRLMPRWLFKRTKAQQMLKMWLSQPISWCEQTISYLVKFLQLKNYQPNISRWLSASSRSVMYLLQSPMKRQFTSSIFADNSPRAAGDILRKVRSLKIITRFYSNLDFSSLLIKSQWVIASQERSISFYTWYLLSSRITLQMKKSSLPQRMNALIKSLLNKRMIQATLLYI